MCLNCSSFTSKLTRQARRDREVTDTPILGKKVTLIIIHRRLLRIGNHFSFKTIRSKILLKQGAELLPETTKDIKKE
jgi:hypothetical protein